MTKEEFIQFYNQNIDKVYRFVFLKVNSKEAAQDLTSTAFLKLLNTIHGENNNIKNPRAFLYQIVRNLVVDFYREKGRQPLPLDESLNLPGAARQQSDFQSVLTSDMEQIKAVLGRIKEEYADIVIWHYLDDLSVPEIAKITGRPEGTVRVMLHRGLEELKKLSGK